MIIFNKNKISPPKMVLCHLLSDIHLEFYKSNPGKGRNILINKILQESKDLEAKYLFLAGDIVNYF